MERFNYEYDRKSRSECIYTENKYWLFLGLLQFLNILISEGGSLVSFYLSSFPHPIWHMFITHLF